MKANIQDSDWHARVAAVEESTDQAQLTTVAIQDENLYVRREAVKRLIDQAVIFKIACQDSDYTVREQAVNQLKDEQLLAQVATELQFSVEQQEVAVARVSNQDLLKGIALNADWRRAGIRIAAVNRITNQNYLMQIAMLDATAYNYPEYLHAKFQGDKIIIEQSVGRVRAAAAARLNSQEDLLPIALKDKEFEVRRSAFEKLTHENKTAAYESQGNAAQYYYLALNPVDQVTVKKAANDSDADVRFQAVRQLEDRAELKHIAISDVDDRIRVEALARLADQTLYSEIAIADKSDFVRRAAVNCLTNLTILENIAVIDSDSSVRLEATKKIVNQELLFSIAVKDASEHVRHSAILRLTNQVLLATIAEREASPVLCRNAFNKVIDETLKERILSNTRNAAFLNEVGETSTNTAQLALIALRSISKASVRLKGIPHITRKESLLSVSGDMQRFASGSIEHAARIKLFLLELFDNIEPLSVHFSLSELTLPYRDKFTGNPVDVFQQVLSIEISNNFRRVSWQLSAYVPNETTSKFHYLGEIRSSCTNLISSSIFSSSNELAFYSSEIPDIRYSYVLESTNCVVLANMAIQDNNMVVREAAEKRLHQVCP